MGNGANLTLDDVLSPAKWKEIQEHFSEVLGVSLTTLDIQKRPLTRRSCNCDLRDDVLMESKSSIAKCASYIASGIEQITKHWKDGLRCSLGFYNFFIPMQLLNKPFAYIRVGPVILGKRPSQEICRQRAMNDGLDPEKFLSAVSDIKAFSFYGIRSIIELLYDISSYILELEYQNIRLKELVPECPQVFGRVYDFCREKMLNALLEVCFDFTKAQRGSLMLLDDRGDTLYIKSAKGIDKDIVDNTSLRIGEGIAGMVARKKQSLFIDNNVHDRDIKKRLHKPEIKSSLSAPINVDDKVIGVLNISTYNESNKSLAPASLDTIDRMIKLVETTLKNFPQT